VRLNVKISGMKELDHALSFLPKAAAKSTLVRVAKKAGQPIADLASDLAPVDTGELSSSVSVGTRISNRIGKKEYAQVMQSGGTKEEARSALIAARAGTSGSFAVVYVGPKKARTKRDAIKRIVQEFGSKRMRPKAYMRPAWDAKKNEALRIIQTDLGKEIIATARRIGKSKSARYTDAIKSSASVAAMLAAEE